MRERIGEHAGEAGGDDLEHEFWHDEPSGLHRLLSGLRREPSHARPAARRTRSHRVVVAAPPEPATEPAHDTVQRRAVDPLLARIGAMSLVVAFIVPVAVSLRDDNGAPRLTASPVPTATSPSTADPTASSAATTETPPTTAAPTTTKLDPRTLPPATPVYVEAAPATTATPATTAATARTASASAQTVVQRSCSKSYTVAAGDYWILVAKKVGVSLRELLDANGATTTTALYPGRTVCLPANASPPTTVAKPVTTTTKPVTTTTAPKPVTTTTKPKPPATTAPPPTTQAPKRTYTRAEVEQIIRDVWPDHLEEEALRIAWRESNYVPTAKNYCCYGVFQIYFNVHKGWLAGLGVTSANQLFDPVVNAKAAYTLYLRSNGWGPWKL